MKMFHDRAKIPPMALPCRAMTLCVPHGIPIALRLLSYRGTIMDMAGS